jgi:outer membrane protein, heavy metal efflux system
MQALLLLALGLATASPAPPPAPSLPPAAAPVAAAGGETAPAEGILATLEDPLAAFVREVLARNPEIARARARAAAAAVRAPQVAALPDPMAELMVYLMPPETRVGPTRAMARFAQTLPWIGKLRLREQAALLEAGAAAARVEAARLQLLTEARRLAYELAFLDAWEAVVREDRATLGHYEEVARARYASGVGLEQAVVKIQAEITQDDARLLEIAASRATLLAAANALRDRPAAAPLAVASIPPLAEVKPDPAGLEERALARRPEVGEADLTIAAAAARTGLAEKQYRPDVTLGLTYAVVDKRDDRAGRLSPPEGNGADDLGISAGVNLPVWRRKLAAGVAEAVDMEGEAREGRRMVVTGIGQALGDLARRLPLTWDRLRLFDDVLAIQAAESLRSAEAGYRAGTLGALDLLDAERVLLEVRVASERARADYAIALAQLEGAVGSPLTSTAPERGAKP